MPDRWRGQICYLDMKMVSFIGCKEFYESGYFSRRFEEVLLEARALSSFPCFGEFPSPTLEVFSHKANGCS